MQFAVVGILLEIIDCLSLLMIYSAVGQGIYFAREASTSLSYTQPDANKNRHMFMGKNKLCTTSL